jgi:hypothetical protein
LGVDDPDQAVAAIVPRVQGRGLLGIGTNQCVHEVSQVGVAVPLDQAFRQLGPTRLQRREDAIQGRRAGGATRGTPVAAPHRWSDGCDTPGDVSC